jgi:ankyrin repeat protein
LHQRVAFYDTSPNLQPPKNDGDDKQKRYSHYQLGEHGALPILHTACQRKAPNLKMVKLLVETCNVDINARSKDTINGTCSNATALHWLASADSFWQLEAIRYLVGKGAEINATNANGQTPLHIAAAGYVSVNSHPLLSNAPCSTLSPSACVLSRFRFLRILEIGRLMRPSSRIAEDIMGGYESGGFWRPQCVDLLLSLGANPNTVDTNGRTPLYEAASPAHITRSLLRGGAELSAGKISPIFNAILQQNIEVLTAILDAGGDVNAVTTPFSIKPAITDQARTALFCASFALDLNRHVPESVPLIKLLIDRGADMYAALNDRETLIHYLFEHGEYEAVCAYLDCHEKINLEARDQLGRTVLLAACNVPIPFLCLESFRFLNFAVLGFPSRVSSSSVPNLCTKIHTNLP